MIDFGTQKHHWNYFLAIEQDLQKVSRYIEFSDANKDTYGIELAHILLSASSEVDVVMKLICELLSPTKAKNIDNYRTIIEDKLPDFIQEEVYIKRYGMKFKPWENWAKNINPDWWGSYNNVKHFRDEHFNEANLKNTINSVGALLLVIVYFYKLTLSIKYNRDVSIGITLNYLLPESNFLNTKHALIQATIR